jgi:putative peptide zinc metalloprotease protein
VLELVLPDRTRVPLLDDTTIGRAPGNTIQLADPAVSRRHARISVAHGDRETVVVLEDLGSSHGTWLDDRAVNGPEVVADGSRIRVGDQELLVERRRDDAEAGATIVVRPGDSLVVPAGGGRGVHTISPGERFGARPRIRSGYALKRLDASEGERWWVLRDLESDRFLRMSQTDADLFALLDGRHSLADLVGEAERRDGAEGAARLLALLAELADRGLLAGVAPAEGPAAASIGPLRRLARPREKTWSGAGRWFERLYRRGAWRVFTPPARAAIGVLVVAGLVAFPYLVVARYGTPFVVAHKVGLGALIFVVGRFAVVAAHESAHALTMASYGRRIGRAGIKLVLAFPYAFVDTSEAWFEPARRRIAVSAAGPVSDLSMGALFALSCLALPAGAPRDVFFQLAFAAYVGAVFNLNPFVERDGYQILVDALREPGLRRRAREQLVRRLSGGGRANDSRMLTRYAAAGVAWSAIATCFAAGMSLRYEPQLAAVAPEPAVWAAFAMLWSALFVPVAAVVGRPLSVRWRRSPDH